MLVEKDSDLLRDQIVLRLEGVTQVDRDPDWVFRELHNPVTLLRCVPGASLTRLVGPRRFEARIVFGAGPLKFAYAGAGRITGSDPQSRTASMTLNENRPSDVPRIRIRMTMAIDRHPHGSEIQMSFRVVVSDRTGLVRRAWVDPIAWDLLDRTIRRVKQELEDTPLSSGPTAA